MKEIFVLDQYLNFKKSVLFGILYIEERDTGIMSNENILLNFIGWLTIDTNEFEKDLIDHKQVFDYTIMNVVCHNNLEDTTLMKSLSDFMQRDRKNKDKKYIKCMNVFGVNWICAYMVGKYQYTKYVNTNTNINKQYEKDVRSFIKHLATKLKSKDLDTMQNMLNSRHSNMISAIRDSAKYVDIVANRYGKFRWNLFKKHCKALVHMSHYSLNNEEKKIKQCVEIIHKG